MDYLPALAKGLWVTIYISGASIFGGTTLGLFVAIATKSSLRPIRILGLVYINLFLAFPVLVLLIWIYYCVPVLTGVRINSAWTAILALTLSLAGFVGDILRGGIDAVPKGQIESAITLGLTWPRIMRRIILPQAIRIMVPPILGQYITCVKLSALASVIAVYELLHVANNIISRTFQPLETYTVVAILYLMLIWPFVRFMRRFEVRSTAALESTRQTSARRDFFKWFRNA